MSANSRVSALEPTEALLLQRAEALAVEVDEQAAEDTVSILCFRLVDEWYGVEVERVLEIYQEYEVTPIPCVPDHILGVVNMRGEIISVTDLARLMHTGEASMHGAQSPAVVVGDGECATAIVVDEVGDIADVPVTSLEPPLSAIDRHHAEFAAGAVEIDGRMFGLLNVDRILEPVGEGERH